MLSRIYGTYPTADILLRSGCLVVHEPETVVLAPLNTPPSTKPINHPNNTSSNHGSIWCTEQPPFLIDRPKTLTIQSYKQKFIQVAQWGSIWKYPGLPYLKTYFLTPIRPTTEKFYQNAPENWFFKAPTKTPYIHPAWSPPYHPTKNTYTYLTLLHLIHGLYHATFGSHRGHIVIVVN